MRACFFIFALYSLHILSVILSVYAHCFFRLLVVHSFIHFILFLVAGLPLRCSVVMINDRVEHKRGNVTK